MQGGRTDNQGEERQATDAGGDSCLYGNAFFIRNYDTGTALVRSREAHGLPLGHV